MLRDADQVRQLPGGHRVRPLGHGAAEDRARPASISINSGPERVALSRLAPAVPPASRRRAAPTTRRALSRPFTLEMSRDDGDQEPDRDSTSTRRPASRVAARRPVLPRGGHRSLSAGAYTGRRRAGRSALSGREPASGSITVGAGRRAAARSTSAATSTSAGPTRAPPSAFVVVIPAVSGPYDLGNVVVRVAVYVDPGDRADHGGLRPAAADPRWRPAAAALLQVSLDRPELRPQPDPLRPVLGRDAGDRRRRGTGRPRQPLPGRQLRRPGLRAGAQPGSDRRPQTRAATRRSTRVFKAQPGEANTQPCLGHAAEGRAARQRPHRHGLHAGRVRRRRLPGRAR